MKNPFKAGDEVTVTISDPKLAELVTRYTTKGKTYTLTHTGLDNPDRYHTELDVVFEGDLNTVILHAEHVTLVKE